MSYADRIKATRNDPRRESKLTQLGHEADLVIDNLAASLEGMIYDHDHSRRIHAMTGGEEWPDGDSITEARKAIAQARGEEQG